MISCGQISLEKHNVGPDIGIIVRLRPVSISQTTAVYRTTVFLLPLVLHLILQLHVLLFRIKINVRIHSTGKDVLILYQHKQT